MEHNETLSIESHDVVGKLRSGTLSQTGKYLELLSTGSLNRTGDDAQTPLRPTSATSAHTQDANMKKFLSGFKRFQKNYFAENTELFNTLKAGQSPKTVLVGCCDSRVDPALITDCDPGDLFVIRNVANLVAPYEPDNGKHGVSAALEYAVKILHVENIIVLGHSTCGGIDALLKGLPDDFEFIGPWVRIAERAKEKTLKYFANSPYEVQRRACEHASILQSLENLVTYPWINERLLKGELNITGWYFDFGKGDLLGYNPDTLNFEPLL